MDFEAEIYHQIANWSIYMAEGVFGLAAVAVAKTVIWPPLAFYLREKWDWPQSKGISRPSAELPDDKALEGMHVLISMKEAEVLADVTRKIEKKKKDLAASQSPMMGPSNDE
ncbi:hypothetical protein DAPPUDRAFT_105136 [Daphnia pulex]|uniref:Uncharacterized protein n=1 Tax=Daphnia pulex TaxID=6669 RepID=E9GPL7_DAPPU|nr:hypothetical protein DAPPUDRAFT_105136 [Daphnia pulex]|eukprot:EFX78566.1 hypothetical protein DAPPUDRAFT_105136 [Daphnia pulex]